jgi:hypothetical protein
LLRLIRIIGFYHLCLNIFDYGRFRDFIFGFFYFVGFLSRYANDVDMARFRDSPRYALRRFLNGPALRPGAGPRRRSRHRRFWLYGRRCGLYGGFYDYARDILRRGS